MYLIYIHKNKSFSHLSLSPGELFGVFFPFLCIVTFLCYTISSEPSNCLNFYRCSWYHSEGDLTKKTCSPRT